MANYSILLFSKLIKMKSLKNLMSTQLDSTMMDALKGGNVATVTIQTPTTNASAPPRNTTSQAGAFSFGYENNPHDPSVNVNPNNP